MKEKYEINESYVIQYLQGEITQEETEKLLQWLNESESHKQLFFDIKHIHELNKLETLPTDYVRQSWNRLETKLHATKKNVRLAFWAYVAVAIMAIGLTLGVQQIFHTELPVQNTVISTEGGSKISYMLLPDGTKVTLNKATHIRYNTDFGKKLRTVFLDGEALFEVTKNKSVPFIVYTNKQRIEVLGTVFNVQDYADEDYAVTTLISGLVKMQSKNGSDEYNDFIYLKPHQQAFIDFSNKQYIVSKVDIDNKMWINKILYFNNDPFYHILQRLEKIYGVTIILTNQGIKDVRYSGTFSTDQPIERVLEIINYDKQFSFVVQKDKIIIN